MVENLEKLDDFLDDISIEYFITNSVLGDDLEEGYVCVYIKTDEDENVKKILEKLEFKQIKHDFYYQPLCDFSEINEGRFDEIKLYYADRMSKNIKAGQKLMVLETLIEKWKVLKKG